MNSLLLSALVSAFSATMVALLVLYRGPVIDWLATFDPRPKWYTRISTRSMLGITITMITLFHSYKKAELYRQHMAKQLDEESLGEALLFRDVPHLAAEAEMATS